MKKIAFTLVVILTIFLISVSVVATFGIDDQMLRQDLKQRMKTETLEEDLESRMHPKTLGQDLNDRIKDLDLARIKEKEEHLEKYGYYLDLFTNRSKYLGIFLYPEDYTEENCVIRGGQVHVWFFPVNQNCLIRINSSLNVRMHIQEYWVDGMGVQNFNTNKLKSIEFGVEKIKFLAKSTKRFERIGRMSGYYIVQVRSDGIPQGNEEKYFINIHTNMTLQK